jgi:hypothetical protein
LFALSPTNPFTILVLSSWGGFSIVKFLIISQGANIHFGMTASIDSYPS